MQIVIQLSLTGDETFVPDFNEVLALILRSHYNVAKKDLEKNLREDVPYSVGTSISYTAVEAIDRMNGGVK